MEARNNSGLSRPLNYVTVLLSLSLHRAFRRNIYLAHELMHTHKIVHIKTFEIAPTYFDPKIIFRELHCSPLKSHF